MIVHDGLLSLRTVHRFGSLGACRRIADESKAGKYYSERGAKKEHSQSYVTDEQRSAEQYLSLVGHRVVLRQASRASIGITIGETDGEMKIRYRPQRGRISLLSPRIGSHSRVIHGILTLITLPGNFEAARSGAFPPAMTHKAGITGKTAGSGPSPSVSRISPSAVFSRLAAAIGGLKSVSPRPVTNAGIMPLKAYLFWMVESNSTISTSAPSRQIRRISWKNT